jgi:hypothetical protein
MTIYILTVTSVITKDHTFLIWPIQIFSSKAAFPFCDTEFKKLQTSLQSVDKELDKRKIYVYHVAGTHCPYVELVPYEMITFILNRT